MKKRQGRFRLPFSFLPPPPPLRFRDSPRCHHFTSLLLASAHLLEGSLLSSSSNTTRGHLNQTLWILRQASAFQGPGPRALRQAEGSGDPNPLNFVHGPARKGRGHLLLAVLWTAPLAGVFHSLCNPRFARSGRGGTKPSKTTPVPQLRLPKKRPRETGAKPRLLGGLPTAKEGLGAVGDRGGKKEKAGVGGNKRARAVVRLCWKDWFVEKSFFFSDET